MAVAHGKGDLVDKSRFRMAVVHKIGGLVDKSRFWMAVVHQKGGLVEKWRRGVGWLTKNVHRARDLMGILYVGNSVVSALEEFLLAHSSYEFLEIERFEVCDIFESFFFICLESWLEHCSCIRVALAEVCVRVLDDVSAFAGAVADEEAWSLLQVFCEAVFVDDCRCSFSDLAIGGRSLDFARDDSALVARDDG